MFTQIIVLLMLLLGLALGGAAYRLTAGPTIPDRMVALNLIIVQGTAMTALYMLASQREHLLDTMFGAAVALLLGSVALARFIEQRGSE
jgi:multicomponent Na+:H+ antiporter subunit F